MLEYFKGFFILADELKVKVISKAKTFPVVRNSFYFFFCISIRF